jgi:NAD(P)-dependent dehydrogenase (short-subunit alcohol dehydrogenase family)
MPANSPLITTRFDSTSTADDVVAGVDLSGFRAVVTGGSSGIGLETARSLVRAGADVTLAVRNTGNGRQAAADITESTGKDGVHVAALDLSDRAASTSRTTATRSTRASARPSPNSTAPRAASSPC